MSSPSIISTKSNAPSGYEMRPSNDKRFKKRQVEEILHACLGEELAGFSYTSEAAEQKSNTLAEVILTKIAELGFPRYKYIVAVTIGEQRGEGAKLVARCLWDSDTDALVFDNFHAVAMSRLCVPTTKVTEDHHMVLQLVERGGPGDNRVNQQRR